MSIPSENEIRSTCDKLDKSIGLPGKIYDALFKTAQHRARQNLSDAWKLELKLENKVDLAWIGKENIKINTGVEHVVLSKNKDNSPLDSKIKLVHQVHM